MNRALQSAYHRKKMTLPRPSISYWVVEFCLFSSSSWSSLPKTVNWLDQKCIQSVSLYQTDLRGTCWSPSLEIIYWKFQWKICLPWEHLDFFRLPKIIHRCCRKCWLCSCFWQLVVCRVLAWKFDRSSNCGQRTLSYCVGCGNQGKTHAKFEDLISFRQYGRCGHYN